MAIPDPVSLDDAFRGVVIRHGQRYALALSPVADGETLATGDFVVRYGVRLLEKAHLSIVPGLVALDYGEMLTGESAWDFIWRRGNRFPRAEVVGWLYDGQDDMIMMRALDLALPPDVFVYADATSYAPLARVEAVIADADALASADATAFHPRILEYLPQYPTITSWKAAP